jgi:periplasmic mercuric ion binding protein
MTLPVGKDFDYIWQTNYPAMKKMMLSAGILLVSLGFARGQTRPSQTVTIKTPTVQCEECKKRIENYLAREEGIYKTVVDYKRKLTKVSFYTDRTNIENIKAAIANAGYDADDIAANPDSYQKLPKCCKKPAEGGNPPPKKE